VEEGLLSPQADIQVPEIPMDLATAVKLKKVCGVSLLALLGVCIVSMFALLAGFQCWLYMDEGVT
jgi:hypothetical protein